MRRRDLLIVRQTHQRADRRDLFRDVILFCLRRLPEVPADARPSVGLDRSTARSLDFIPSQGAETFTDAVFLLPRLALQLPNKKDGVGGNAILRLWFTSLRIVTHHVLHLVQDGCIVAVPKLHEAITDRHFDGGFGVTLVMEAEAP